MWSVTLVLAAQDTTYYQDSGEMKSIGLSIDDQRVGLWNFYYVSGTLSAQLVYREGSLDGKQQYYYPNGSLQAIEIWDQDALCYYFDENYVEHIDVDFNLENIKKYYLEYKQMSVEKKWDICVEDWNDNLIKY